MSGGGPTSEPIEPARWRVRDTLLSGAIAALRVFFQSIPIDWATSIGAGFGRLWFALRMPRVTRVQQQLARAFPEAGREQLERWARGVFLHLGRGLAELFVLAGKRRARLLDRVEIEGLEHLAAAEAESESGGVLVATAHFGNWELAAARIAAEGIPISVVYRGLESPALDQALGGLRAASGPGGIREDSADHTIQQLRRGNAGLSVLAALRRGRKVLMLLDQDADRQEGLFVPFFGRWASTRDAPVRIAVKRGIPILPAFIRRDPDGRGHRIRIHPALQLERQNPDDEEVVRRNLTLVSAAIEDEIRECPEQWIWTHRRWRTQPRESGTSVGES